MRDVSTRILRALVGVFALICATAAFATGMYPGAELHFSAPARDPQEIVAVLAQVLEARHYRTDVVSDPFQQDGRLVVAPNGHFRAIYRTPSGEQVSINGLGLGCIVVRIFNGELDGVTPDFAAGKELRHALVEHLRAVYGERMIRYKVEENGPPPCVHAL